MARRTSQPKALPNLVVSREEACKKIKEQIRKGRRISNLEVRNKGEAARAYEAIFKWSNYTHELLSRAFDGPSIAREFHRAGDVGLIDDPSPRQIGRWLSDSASSSVFALENILSRLDLIPEVANLQSASAITEASLTALKDVFVVHGHDELAKESVARLINCVGLRAVILHEQANLNRTIIEKLELHSSVYFAVVILTPDDVGWPASDSSKAQSRARQNVIFELGYFIGKLGREKVCALYKGDVELPSDFHGVLYLPMDSEGAWRLKLAKEIKAAGLDVQLNNVY
jgi:predicted nucleotide-binding protein